MTTGFRVLRQGHAPNCSSAGAVVGMALLSAVLGSAVLNFYAARLAALVRRGPSGDHGGGGGGSDGGPGAAGRAASTSGGDGPGPLNAASHQSEPATLLRTDAGTRLHFDSDGAVLAIDDAWTDRLVEVGLPIRDARGGPPPPLEVHIGVTHRCPASCSGCYTGAVPRPQQADPTFASLVQTLDELAQMGVHEVAFGGGEAALRPDILELAQASRDRGLVPNLTTSGFGVSTRWLKDAGRLFGQINISLDGLGNDYRAVRGWDGAAGALSAIDALAQAGVRIGVNTVLTAESWPSLPALGDTLAERGVAEWFWLRWKPVGRGLDSEADRRLRPEQALDLWPRLLDLEARTGLVMRLDCALVPFLVAHGPPLPRLQALGVEGCSAGDHLWARAADGRWAACSFAPGPNGSPAPLAWREDPFLQRWREGLRALPEPCSGCAYASVCRGGCRVVAAARGAPHGPDPDCPTVLAFFNRPAPAVAC